MGGFPLTSSPTLPSIADGLAGTFDKTATTAATDLVIVPAGRTWVGVLVINCAVQNAGANAAVGQATVDITFTDANSFPGAGNHIRVTALTGANVAAGTVGDGSSVSVSVPITVISATSNNHVQAASTITGTGGEVNVFATGFLQ